ncbi:lasso peptide biosynthesis B2 protein [Pengzhenrongella sicca]|uniref:Lasso peptide biosynthesis B2 protein n=1 Tax=Pengzhenrongella sicca TaxID=2819238 RepID=A0A8A4ZES9_9MICO|nr:lasso peptide biosynthesis B2 protein [Pengzhenrongella sicca]QTE29423.1 lasso peptide biosynthesis B2 protein [Pengzhenrongella sicca]
MTAADRAPVSILEAARCLALDQAAAAASAALTERDIRSVLLKGSGLAERLYPDPSRRAYLDVDLLVAPADFDRTQQVLRDLGYTDLTAGMRADELLWYERQWRPPGDGWLTIDLHRGFAGVGDPDAFWRELRSGAQQRTLAGGVVAVPDAAGCALVVALHAAAPGYGDKAAQDLAAALAVLPAPVWTAAASLARAAAAEQSFAEGLRQTADGAAVAASLGLASSSSPVTILTAHRVEPSALSLAHLVALRGARARSVHVARRLVPSAAAMRRSSALANRGRPGLAAAYLLRIGNLAARAPAAARELHQVRQARAAGSTAPGPTAPAAQLPTLGDGLRIVRRLTWAEARTCGWALWALLRVRRALRRGPLIDVEVAPPPRGTRRELRAAQAVLRRTRASCLERSLLLQRWYARHGVACDLVIGVTAPGSGFHAHAWLEGEGLPAARVVGTELLRRPTPERWLAGS